MRLWRFVVFTVVSAMVALPSLAQMHRRAAPLYNTATEVTVTGSVEAVDQIQGRGWGGTHLTVKTEKETIDVHVGPSWFLTQNKIVFAKGDQIEVTGSRVKFGEQDALIARQIKNGGETITLRDKLGFPEWAGHRPPIS